jgi:hypothetical protein
MCVLKYSKLLSLTVRKEYFNTLPFLAPEEEFHPIGRPFVHVLSADWDLVSLNTFAINLH